MYFKRFDNEKVKSQLSGKRFYVTYKISGNEKEAYAKAKDICVEQTVEFPPELIPEGAIPDSIIGKVEQFEQEGENEFKTVISYAIETATDELTQILNVIFGNISIKPGILVEKIDFSEDQLAYFKGPRFGVSGLRELLNIKKRPLIFTALKPMGLSAGDFADVAYQLALGGIDIIKDDHGLANQCFAPYEKRVGLCARAVERANRETGGHTIYVPSVNAPIDKIIERVRIARDCGAGGVMLSPGIAGFDSIRRVSSDDKIGLPVISHPAFLGSYVVNPGGFSCYSLLGQLVRFAGADATIFPNYGGRFSLMPEQCRGIAAASRDKMGEIKPIFPCPAGGMSLDKIPDVISFYGQDVILLIGGGLFGHGPDLTENCRYFRDSVGAQG